MAEEKLHGEWPLKDGSTLHFLYEVNAMNLPVVTDVYAVRGDRHDEKAFSMPSLASDIQQALFYQKIGRDARLKGDEAQAELLQIGGSAATMKYIETAPFAAPYITQRDAHYQLADKLDADYMMLRNQVEHNVGKALQTGKLPQSFAAPPVDVAMGDQQSGLSRAAQAARNSGIKI